MECYCEPAGADDTCQVWEESWPRARVPHKCCECSELITVGHLYQRINWVFDGTAGTYKTCAFCAAEFARLQKKHSDMPFVKGDLACILVWDMRNEVVTAERTL